MIFHLSAGNRHDAPEGRKLIESIYSEDYHYLLMDRAYEDDKTRALAEKQGFIPVSLQNVIAKNHEIMIKNFINVVMKLKDFS